MATSTPDRDTTSSGQQAPDRPPRRDPKLGFVVARPFGIPVYISPYWLIFAVVLVVMYANGAEANLASTQSRYIVAAAFVLLLYVSVLVHELAHCVVARGFGLPVRRVLLYPLGGYSEIEQEPATPGREALISGAGPAVSLALAGLGYELAKVVPAGLTHQLIAQLFFANLIVGIFNLLPGLPLDGGRIFRAGVWKITGRQTAATMAAAWAGRVLAIVLVGLALFGQRRSGSFVSLYWLWLLVIAGFIWIQSTQAIKAAKHPRAAAGGQRQDAGQARDRESRPACRSPRRSGALRRPAPGRWSSWTTRTRRPPWSARPRCRRHRKSAGRGSRSARWPGRSALTWCCQPTCPAWT